MGWSEYKIYTDKLAELSNIFNELIYLSDNFDINRSNKFIISIIENYDFYILEDENDELSNGYSDLDDDYKLSEDILACDEYINMIEYINENFKKMYDKYILYINKIESLSSIYLEDLRQVNISVIENFKSEYNAVIFNLELLEQQLSYIPNEKNIDDKNGIFNIDVLLITNNSIMYGFGYNFLKSYFIKNLHVINKDTYDITYSDQIEFNNKINKIYSNVYKVFIKTLINGKAKKFNEDFHKELKGYIKKFKAESKIEQDKAASEIESLKDKKKLKEDEKRQKEEEKAKRKEKEIKDADEKVQKDAERKVDELKITLDIDNKANAELDKTMKEEAVAAKKAEEEEAKAAEKAKKAAEAAEKAKEEAEEAAEKAKEEAVKKTEEEAKKAAEEEAKKAKAVKSATKPEEVEKIPDTKDANVKKLLNILTTHTDYIKTPNGKIAPNLGLENEQQVIYKNFQPWFEKTYPDLKDKISGIPSLSAKSLQISSPPIYSPPPIPQRNNSLYNSIPPAYPPPIPHLQNNVYSPTYPPSIPQQNISSRSVTSSNLQKSDFFKFGGKNIYQGYIPDDIWERIKDHRMSYLSKIPLYIDIINKWNDKFINIAKMNEEWKNKKKNNPKIRIKEEEAFYINENKKKDYWDKQKRTRSDVSIISRQEIEEIGEIPNNWKKIRNSLGNDNIDAIYMAEGYDEVSSLPKTVKSLVSKQDFVKINGSGKIIQRYISDEIWEIIKNITENTQYLSLFNTNKNFKNIIDKWNNKFIKDATLKENWEIEKKYNKGEKIKEEEEYYKKEKEKKAYWDNKKANDKTGLVIIHEIKAIGNIPGWLEKAQNELEISQYIADKS